VKKSKGFKKTLAKKVNQQNEKIGFINLNKLSQIIVKTKNVIKVEIEVGVKVNLKSW